MKAKKSFSPAALAGGLLIFAGIFIIAYQLITQYQDDKAYKELEDLYSKSQTAEPLPNEVPDKTLAAPQPSSVPAPSSPSPSPQILEKYHTLLSVNKEVVGWITIPDTAIDYPLLQHVDNNYYLSYDLNNELSVYGSIYIDHRNSPSLHNQNTLIYGHNMNNGSMFHDLLRFKEEDFFTSHPYLYIDDLYERHTYEVFAVYVVNADVETVEVAYPNDEDFLSYLEACQERSLYSKDMNFTAQDEIVTLVTCSYELSNARTLVQARRIPS